MVAHANHPKESDYRSPPAANGAEISSILVERETSSRIAVVSPEQSRVLSYAGLSRTSKALTAELQRHGLRRQDRVAILLPTSIEFAVAFFGASAAGAVVVPLDIFMKRADLVSVLNALQPTFLVTNPSLFRKIRLDRLPLTVCVLEFSDSLSVSFHDASGSRVESGDRSVESEPAPRAEVPAATPDEEDAVMILSSGSMGAPKAVRLSHRAVLRNIAMHLESLELTENICGLQVLPLNYSYGLIASFLSTLQSGGVAVLLPNPNPASVIAALTHYEVNLLMGTPAIFQYVIENAPPGSNLRTSPVRYLTLGGDRCRPYTLNLISARMPAANIYITYGLTETGPRVSTLPPRFVKEIPDSVGLPLRGVEVSILDDRGRNRAPGEVGEIVVRTPSLMSGYFGDPLGTNRVLRDGRCHTGDVGFLDESGFLYYLGRKDRQFKFGGRMVNPAVIEQCVASHPLVQEVTVRKSDNGHAEWLCASVKARKSPSQHLLDDLKKHCRKSMPAHLVPGEFRFEAEDHYYHKGRPFRPAKEVLPDPASAEGVGSPETERLKSPMQIARETS